MKKKAAVAWVLSWFLVLSGCSGLETKKVSTLQEGVRLPVVMYHHLTTHAGYANEYTLTVAQFEKDLQYIRAKGYQTITLSQLTDYQKGQGEIPEKPILITFDDGFESFKEYALPLLEEYDLQAVMAVVGEFADRFTEHEDHNVSYSYLGWKDIADLATHSRVDIISHTYAMHSNNGNRKGCNQKNKETNEQYTTVLQEDQSRLVNRFEQYGIALPIAIAFPFGYYNAQTLENCRQMGFQVVFTCRERVNIIGLQNETFLVLGRYNRPSGKSSTEFFKPLLSAP